MIAQNFARSSWTSLPVMEGSRRLGDNTKLKEERVESQDQNQWYTGDILNRYIHACVRASAEREKERAMKERRNSTGIILFHFKDSTFLSAEKQKCC